MKKRMKLFRSMIFVLVCLMLVTLPGIKTQAKVKLSAKSVAMVAGKVKKIKVSGTSEKAIWTSRNPAVATVSEKGYVKAIKAGTTYVDARIGQKIYSCKIKVVALNTYSLILPNVGSKATLKVYNGNKTKWKSSNSKIVKVSSKGVVKAKKSGVVTITCTSRGKKMKCKVYVPKWNGKQTTLRVYHTTSVKLSNAPSVSYSSSDKSVLKVDSKGVCTGLKRGFAYAIAKSGPYTYKCGITVGQNGDIFTPSSWVGTKTRKAKYSQKIHIGGGRSRTYTVYGQGYGDNKFKENIVVYFDPAGKVISKEQALQTPGYTSKTYSVKSYLGNHGCAACSTTTVLSGFASYAYPPTTLISKTESYALGYTAWNKNYSKSSSDQMPLSLYGVQQVLVKYNVKSKYVRSYSSNSVALAQIADHLLTGKPVVICVGTKNHITGKTSTRWTSGRHTMVLLGMTDTYKVIVADPADRSSSTFGTMGRIKIVDLSDVGAYLFSSSKTSGTNATAPYYTSASYCGGYILVDTQ